MVRWWRRTALPQLLGIPLDTINDDRLYRCLDVALPYKGQIEELRARQETARKKLEELKRTGGEAWEDLRSGAEAALAAQHAVPETLDGAHGGGIGERDAEGLGRGAAAQRVQERRFDLEEAPLVQEAAQRLHHCRAGAR